MALTFMKAILCQKILQAKSGLNSKLKINRFGQKDKKVSNAQSTFGQTIFVYIHLLGEISVSAECTASSTVHTWIWPIGGVQDKDIVAHP